MVRLADSRLAWLTIEAARLNLPVTFTMDGATVVIDMPADLDTATEVRALCLVEQLTDDFRRHVA